MITVILFDLDGVVRHFDPRLTAAIERRHAMTPGDIGRAAFRSPLIEDVTTGRLSRAEWEARITADLGNADAVAEWSRQPASADPAVLALAGALRERGLRTAILTNGTDRIPEEVAELGLGDRFDAIFNTAAIGYAKPDPRAFRHVLEVMGVAPDAVLFTDDSPGHVAAARRVGMVSQHFVGVAELVHALEENGVPVDLSR
ncbi:HAD family phosphatase [Microbacterium hominis]|uniref:HAD family hydrolase n=1 Tax=Microbacterium hominis TaxID=162426 RepID=UPI001963C0CD|nr:HAD family phosphatase [Microbacterium hominis]QRY40131.1 HAD family phosphatase [Microbacterium hominis]